MVLNLSTSIAIMLTKGVVYRIFEEKKEVKDSAKLVSEVKNI